jgi:biotin transport system substrate-specific component
LGDAANWGGPQVLSPTYERARNLALVSLFAALTVALGVVYIPLPFSPVPVTGQTLGVMLAGGVLGARLGFLSQALVLALVAVGLPVLAGGRGGLGVLVGPSAGYLLAWPLGALVIGWLAARLPAGRLLLPSLLGAMLVGGILVIYVPGVLWLSFITGRPLAEAALAGGLAFMPGDLTKAVAAALATRALWAVYRPRRAGAARMHPHPAGRPQHSYPHPGPLPAGEGRPSPLPLGEAGERSEPGEGPVAGPPPRASAEHNEPGASTPPEGQARPGLGR